jgi:hypothetical protein
LRAIVLCLNNTTVQGLRLGFVSVLALKWQVEKTNGKRRGRVNVVSLFLNEKLTDAILDVFFSSFI